MKKEHFIALVQEFLIYLHTTLRRSAHTQRAYKADLENFLQFWNEQEPTTKSSFQDLVTRYFAVLSKNQKDKKTIARKSSCFSTLSKFITLVKGQEFNIITPRPAIAQIIPTGFAAYTLASILEKINEQLPTKFPYRDKAIVEILYATGIRCSELVALRIHDLNFSNRTLRILGKKNERTVFFGSLAQKSLELYLQYERKTIESTSEKLFLNYQNQPLTTRSIQRICTMFCPNLTPAKLRHSCAIHLIEQGAQPDDVQQLLGFSTALSMEKYLSHSQKFKSN